MRLFRLLLSIIPLSGALDASWSVWCLQGVVSGYYFRYSCSSGLNDWYCWMIWRGAMIWLRAGSAWNTSCNRVYWIKYPYNTRDNQYVPHIQKLQLEKLSYSPTAALNAGGQELDRFIQSHNLAFLSSEKWVSVRGRFSGFEWASSLDKRSIFVPGESFFFQLGVKLFDFDTSGSSRSLSALKRHRACRLPQF